MPGKSFADQLRSLAAQGGGDAFAQGMAMGEAFKKKKKKPQRPLKGMNTSGKAKQTSKVPKVDPSSIA